jgi:hypothetical protein
MRDAALAPVVADERALRMACHQRVGQRAALAGAQRVRGDAGRLVDGDERVVDEEDGQRRLRLGHRAQLVLARRRVRHDDAGAGVHAAALGRACPVDAHVPVVDEPLRLSARALEHARQPLIETRPVVRGGDGEVERAQSTKSAAAERRPHRMRRMMGNGA